MATGSGAAPPPRRTWRSVFSTTTSDEESTAEKMAPPKWSMGVLNDKTTIEVPGSVLLLAKDHNEPLGLRNAPARTSHSSLPTGMPRAPSPRPPPGDGKKKTADGKIILEPQPEESVNDPLNWSVLKRDSALLSLGLYCMLGGGMTTVISAGFNNIAADYDVPLSQVSLTTGLYMMGLGLGSVIFSPTAILWGKRPVYLFGAIIFLLTSVWCALSPSFASLIVARIFQGIAVSPVECLPSATIAEIFFLHERAFRIGIYTLLLLGGKNLIPLVSAAIIQRLGWRWTFWIVAMIVALCGTLLFLFVPETFWDRSPIPRSRKPTRPSLFHRLSSKHGIPTIAAPSTATQTIGDEAAHGLKRPLENELGEETATPASPAKKHARIGFFPETEHETSAHDNHEGEFVHPTQDGHDAEKTVPAASHTGPESSGQASLSPSRGRDKSPATHVHWPGTQESFEAGPSEITAPEATHLGGESEAPSNAIAPMPSNAVPAPGESTEDSEKQSIRSYASSGLPYAAYTTALRDRPQKSFVQQLKPYNGRLCKDKWIKVAIRPFILYAYPAVLWSAAVYACSVGWLIVLSESVAVIYRNPNTYNFTALQAGLVFMSPFIGGILGTAVAGKVSDIVVKAMARRNGGLYEPEFRLVMAIPIVITTVIGLMGFGWSAQERDNFMVPTIFFGLISFGCCLGSTTSITFCIDSYRIYSGEALVTLNFTKNIMHGLVFSLFVTGWIEDDGPKSVFIYLGVIQLVIQLWTIPMFIYGKRLRMWTVRKNLMEKF